MKWIEMVCRSFMRALALTADGRVHCDRWQGSWVLPRRPKTCRLRLDLCYESLGKIHWPGMQYRRDIGRSLGLNGTARCSPFWKALISTVILQAQFSPDLKPPERMRRTSERSSNG